MSLHLVLAFAITLTFGLTSKQVCCARTVNGNGFKWKHFLHFCLRDVCLQFYPKNYYHNLRPQNMFLPNEWQKLSITALKAFNCAFTDFNPTLPTQDIDGQFLNTGLSMYTLSSFKKKNHWGQFYVCIKLFYAWSYRDPSIL